MNKKLAETLYWVMVPGGLICLLIAYTYGSQNESLNNTLRLVGLSTVVVGSLVGSWPGSIVRWFRKRTQKEHNRN